MARGRVWSGVAAKRGGLVDELSGFDKAIEIARARAGIKDGERHELVLYPARGLLAGIKTMTASARVPWSVGSSRNDRIAAAMDARDAGSTDARRRAAALSVFLIRHSRECR